jgi:hypothetical protein
MIGVVSRCLERGINCIDLAGDSEPQVYCKRPRSRANLPTDHQWLKEWEYV